MTDRTKRLFYFVLGVFGLGAITLVLIVALRSGAAAPVMDESGAEQACIAFAKTQFNDAHVRSNAAADFIWTAAPVSQTGGEFVVKVRVHTANPSDIKTCHVRASGDQWVLEGLGAR